MRCHCRRKSETVAYDACCGPYHSGAATPSTAEALMRSRYSAFVERLPGYLRATWHASTRPPALDLDDGTVWLGLQVGETLNIDDATATVAFIARYRVGGRTGAVTETSRFVREDGRWWYVSGDPT